MNTIRTAASCVVTALLILSACTPKYDVDKSTELAELAAGDSTLTQETYSRMITMLDNGYSYMRARIAKAAFESNPTAAINDVIDFMGDSTLVAVHRHSAVLIAALEKAELSSENERRFQKVMKKYDELESSLTNDTTAIDTTFGRSTREL